MYVVIRGQPIFARVGASFENSDGVGGQIFPSMGGHLLNSAYKWGVMNLRA